MSMADDMSGAGATRSESVTRRYAVLLYCARSGSTFLSHRLAAAHPRMAVIPEFRLSHMLLWRPEAEVRALTAPRLLKLMRDDVQIGNLAVPAEALPALADRCAGRPAREVIDTLIEAHLGALGLADRDIVVLKNGRYALNAARAREAFPELRAIHVVRDPRGVVNSMIHTRSPYDGDRVMARGNVLHAARLWLDYVRRVGRLDWPVLEVSYERLVAAPEAETARVAAWLVGEAIATGAAGDGAEAAFTILEAERGMHRLAAGAGVGARAEAWATEMPAWQVAAVEAITGDEMTRRGYGLMHGRDGAPPPLSPRARLHDLARRVVHATSSAARLVVWAASDPRMARLRVRQYVARLRGRY